MMVTATSAACGSSASEDAAGDTDTAPVGAVQCAERLVVVVVDVGELAQLGC
jgi:hypothetical protein